MRTLRIASVSTTAVDRRLFGGWGTVNTRDAPSSDDPVLHAVSGTAVDDGSECIALLDASAAALTAGNNVDVREVATFRKPARMTHAAASQLPFLALTVAAALHSAGLPPGVASIGTDSTLPARVVIAGSSGRLPTLLAGVLTARGVDTYVAAKDGAEVSALQRIGVHEDNVVDHNAVSFCEAFGSADAVIDCVGREQDASARELRRAFGAVYVSAAPPALTTLETDGALAQLKTWGKRWWPARGNDAAAQREGPQAVWVSDAAAGDALREILSLIDQGRLEPLEEANEYAEVGELYMEWLTWARDTETGLRCGFPGESLWPNAPPEL